MPAALVGSRGTVLNQAVTTIAPALPQAATAGNLLVAFVGSRGTGNAITCSDGTWTKGPDLVSGSTGRVTIWYKVAVGGDTAPTWSCSAASSMNAGISEFSGCVTSSPLGQIGSGVSTSSPFNVIAGGKDANIWDLVFTYNFFILSASGATTTSESFLNIGGPNNSQTNDGNASVAHYRSSWGATGDNTVNDSNSVSCSNAGTYLSCLASFKVAPKLLSLSATQASQAKVKRSGVKVLKCTQVSTAKVVRIGRKLLKPAQTQSAKVIRADVKKLVLTQAQTSKAVRRPVKSLKVQQSSASKVLRVILKSLKLQESSVAVLAKRFPHRFTVTQASSLTLRKSPVKRLVNTQNSGVSLKRRGGKNFLLQQVGVARSQHGVRRTFRVAISPAVHVLKRSNRVFKLAQGSAAAMHAGKRAFGKLTGTIAAVWHLSGTIRKINKVDSEVKE